MEQKVLRPVTLCATHLGKCQPQISDEMCPNRVLGVAEKHDVLLRFALLLDSFPKVNPKRRHNACGVRNDSTFCHFRFLSCPSHSLRAPQTTLLDSAVLNHGSQPPSENHGQAHLFTCNGVVYIIKTQKSQGQ